MNIEDYDKSINNAMFLTKVDNIYVMLYSSIMKRDLDVVKHKISTDIYNNYKKKVDELKEKKLIQMYGELNVKSSCIVDIKENDDSFIIKVELISRYLNYVIDEFDKKIVSGNNSVREEYKNILTFEKKKNSNQIGLDRKCPKCGASMDLSRSGRCDYCKQIFNMEDYDYILTNIEVI